MVLHFFTEITLKQKIGAICAIGILIVFAYWFNQRSENRRLHLENVLLEFTHGENITCGTTEVNNSQFSYSSGTQTFLGLKESKMSGRIISLDQCK